MNNIQLKIRIDELQPRHDQDGKLTVTGSCSFKFYDKQQVHCRSLPFQAFGQSAVAINEAGVNGVHVISGRLTVTPPSDSSPNHLVTLTIERTILVSGHAVPVVNHQPTVTPEPVAVAGQNGHQKGLAHFSEIPF